MRRFTIDASDRSVVIACTECRTWVELRSTRTSAWEAARDHELAVHPGAKQAWNALSKIATRSVSPGPEKS